MIAGPRFWTTPEFTGHARFIDACSELFGEVPGEAAQHTRSAVGMGSLPFGVPVEIEAIIAARTSSP